jgi:hypothetical protein
MGYLVSFNQRQNLSCSNGMKIVLEGPSSIHPNSPNNIGNTVSLHKVYTFFKVTSVENDCFLQKQIKL